MKLLGNFKTSKTFESGSILVYSISVEKERSNISKYKKYLSVDEIEKALKFKFQIDRERFIIGRAVLRILSGKFLNLNPKHIVFSYGEYGKPDYASKQTLKFNVSHSGDLIVIGFTQHHELGIDVELIKTDFDAIKLAQNFFSKTEIEALEKVPKKELSRAFYRCWTRKESFIKAEGSGLSFPLDQFSVSLDNDIRTKLLQTEWDNDESLNWNLFSFAPDAQYIGAIAVRKKLSRVHYFNWEVKHTEQL